MIFSNRSPAVGGGGGFGGRTELLDHVGSAGRLFELDPDGAIVWECWSPYGPNTKLEGAAAQNPFAIFRAIRIPFDHPGFAGIDAQASNPR